MAKTFYYFNPSTLSFEKAEFKFKDFIKRTLWLIATALAFALVFVWIFLCHRLTQREDAAKRK